MFGDEGDVRGGLLFQVDSENGIFHVHLNDIKFALELVKKWVDMGNFMLSHLIYVKDL